MQLEEAGDGRMKEYRRVAVLSADAGELVEDLGTRAARPRWTHRASLTSAIIIAAQVAISSGRRPRLRRLQRRAAASSKDAGSARSNASAFGMKSNADQRRIVAWLARATRSGCRTAGAAQKVTTHATNVSSKRTCAGIQK